jgi:hypothetical protein
MRSDRHTLWIHAIEKEILTRQRFLSCWFQGDLHAT